MAIANPILPTIIVHITFLGSTLEMIINYRVIVERYPFSNGVVGGSNPVVKSSLYLTGQTS